jgi:hypothetical protein
MLDHGGARSPSQMARELNTPVSTLTYHARVLVARGALRLVGTEPVGGSIKHHYVLGRLVHRNRDLVESFLAAHEPASS